MGPNNSALAHRWRGPWGVAYKLGSHVLQEEIGQWYKVSCLSRGLDKNLQDPFQLCFSIVQFFCDALLGPERKEKEEGVGQLQMQKRQQLQAPVESLLAEIHLQVIFGPKK